MESIKAFIERGNDGTFSVYVDLENKSLNYGIHGNGKTATAAVLDFQSAYKAMKEFHKEKGKHFVEANFRYIYDVPSFLGHYGKILSLAGLERLTGINQGQLSHYVTGHRKPSKTTIAKIEKKLQDFGKELNQVQFI
jgi:hypothetical protein